MSKKQWAVIALLLVHTAGMLGMMSEYRDLFLVLTPANLIISLVLLLYFHEGISTPFLYAMVGIMISGFVIELIGVNTGFPFGSYKYGEPLGPQFMGTPFMIGVNWFILTYCGAVLFKNVSKSDWQNALLAGLTITAFDVVMEPVAIYLDFWTWEADSVPIQNYVTWAVCITLFTYFLYKVEVKLSNPIAKWVFVSQIIFFGGLLIGSKLL